MKGCKNAENKKQMKVVIEAASSSTVFKGKKTIKFRTYSKKKVLADPDNITVSVNYNNKPLADYEAIDPVFKSATSLTLTKIKPSVTLTAIVNGRKARPSKQIRMPSPRLPRVQNSCASTV